MATDNDGQDILRLERARRLEKQRKTRRRERRRGRRFLVVSFVLLSAGLAIDGCAAVGSRATGARLQRMMKSPQWKEGRFHNRLSPEPIPFFSTLWQWIKGADHTRPTSALPIEELSAKDFEKLPTSGLRITWLGHSTQLIEIDGQRVLLDPVWSKRASPTSIAGPKRFHAPPLPLSELPDVDAVVISHDHYDHLDYQTIKVLARAQKKARFVVPLGVGAHLVGWGVEAKRIVELDWWGEARVGKLRLVATPARHFSGRSLLMVDRNKTLWAGWAIIGPQHRVFFSGDTAMFQGFREIGQRLGPFDVAMIEIGAYNVRWRDVHLGPEQAVLAHDMLGAKLMMPVHWGTFDLALHSWTEPIERVLVAAKKRGAKVAIPRPGQSFEPSGRVPKKRWWPKLPWNTAQQDPIRSSKLPVHLVSLVP